MAKRYFWLKLQDNFFNQKEIKMLRKVSGGDTFTIIYLKLLLVSLKNDGKIYYDGIANNMVEEIALDIDEDIENVQITFNFLQQKGLIIFNSDDEIEMGNVHEMIGSESSSASRVRKHRTKKALQSNKEVTSEKQISNGSETLSNTEKSREEKSRERVREETDEKNQEAAAVEINQYYEKNGFGSITDKTKRDFFEWINDFVDIGSTVDEAKEMIIHALDIGIDNNVRKYNYVNSILKDWENHRYVNLEQVEAEDKRSKSNARKRLENSGSSEYDDLF
ncbi:phage replisome organizer N-terminal domain-containing protein [Tetragenococcus halophilus]|uniref:phage replisome organizer N-terminal domain-containing protein n=1 Tax=Tetragenococcus halophilus TaxID=51669 RepID=UPI002A9F2867|nr:hypothetical protein TEHSL10_19530 [Tetragenococcus halophilus]